MSANSNIALTITETDEVDTPLATYLYSETTTATSQDKRSGGGETVSKGRIDVVVSSSSGLSLRSNLWFDLYL